MSKESETAAYAAMAGLSTAAVLTNPWGYPLLPGQEARADQVGALLLAPPGVDPAFLGHPLYWIDFGYTCLSAEDGIDVLDGQHVVARWAVRTWWTIAAFGMWDEHGSPRNVPNTQGIGYTDVDARNYTAGRPTVLDQVAVLTDPHLLITPERLAGDVWAALDTLDPDGNAALAAVRRDQSDRFVADAYVRANTTAAEQAQANAERRWRRIGYAAKAATIVFDLDGVRRKARDDHQRRSDADQRRRDAAQRRLDDVQRREARGIFIRNNQAR